MESEIAIFNPSETELLSKIFLECWNYEHLHFRKNKKFTYEDLQEKSCMTRQTIHRFLQKCFKNGLIIGDPVLIIQNNSSRKAFAFDSVMINEHIWNKQFSKELLKAADIYMDEIDRFVSFKPRKTNE